MEGRNRQGLESATWQLVKDERNTTCRCEPAAPHTTAEAQRRGLGGCFASFTGFYRARDLPQRREPHLDITVGDADPVAVVQRGHELLEKAPHPVLRQWLPLQKIGINL